MEIRRVLIARALALLWAGFWIFFFVAEGRAWRSPWWVMTFWYGVGLVFTVLALVPWKWETTGGVLLVVIRFGLHRGCLSLAARLRRSFSAGRHSSPVSCF